MEALKGVDCRSWGIYNSPFLCIHTRGCCNYRLTQWLGKGEKTQEEGLKRAQVLPSIRKTNRLRLFSLRRTRVVKTCNKKNFFFFFFVEFLLTPSHKNKENPIGTRTGRWQTDQMDWRNSFKKNKK